LRLFRYGLKKVKVNFQGELFTQKMGAACTFEKLVFYNTTGLHNPEELDFESPQPLKSLNSAKVNLSLGLTKYHAMKTCWRCGGTAPRVNFGTRQR
jgi:hypothetical protein